MNSNQALIGLGFVDEDARSSRYATVNQSPLSTKPPILSLIRVSPIFDFVVLSHVNGFFMPPPFLYYVGAMERLSNTNIF